MLQWARAQDPPCLWDEQTCARAAEGGHLHVLQWARAQDPPCPWDEAVTRMNASKRHHWHIMEWFQSQEPPWPGNSFYPDADGAIDGLASE